MRKFFYLCFLFLFITSTLLLFAQPINDAQENFDKMIILADKVDSDAQTLYENLEKLLGYYATFETTRSQTSIENVSLDIDRIVELMNGMEKLKKLHKQMNRLGW